MSRASIFLFALISLGGPTAAQEDLSSGDNAPVVLFDFGHNNAEAASTNVMALLEEEGYEVRKLSGTFVSESLNGIDLVVTPAPLADENALRLSSESDVNAAVAKLWRKPVPSAFSAEEIDVLQAWVRQGGGLLVVVDHFPMPGAVAPLLSGFGIEVSNGFAVDADRLPSLPVQEGAPLGAAGEFVFDRATHTLAEDPVTSGRSNEERVNVVGTFVGSSFRLPDEGRSLLTFGPSSVSLLPEVAWEFSEATPRQAINGWSQGGLLGVGRGRIAVFGELAIMATNLAEAHPEMQNRQLLLNVFRWLTDRSE